jgi:hypothetical protein
MLNPIESLFGKWKTVIRTEGVPFLLQALLESIENSRRLIAVDNRLGWVRNVNRNLGLCLQNHAFYENELWILKL